MSIGFIGLGNIGKPMARQLLKLGEPVWVCDVAETPLAELAQLGARASLHPRELAEHCRIIGLCVRDAREVEQLLQGAQGLLEHLAADTVIAVHSTVAQADVLKWVAQAQRRGIHLIDAPISGGAAGAEAGTLTYMVGGEATVVERCRPVFLTSGHKVIHAGAPGSGILLKLCNNLMTYAAFAAIDEARRLARAGGLDAALLAELGRSNGVVTAQMDAFVTNRAKLSAGGEALLRQVFAPFAQLAEKDLAAALASAHDLRLRLPSTERVAEIIGEVFLRPDQ